MKKAILIFFVLFLGFSLTSEAQNAKQFRRAGDEFALKGNFQDALQQYTRAIELQPNNPVLYLKRADSYEKTSDFINAASDYDRACVFDKKKLCRLL